MAEGHSILRWARSLRSMLGEKIVAVDLPKRWLERQDMVLGQRLTKIETHGKHLVLHFSSGHLIHTHAMMYGSWQFGRPGMQLRKPEKNVRLRLLSEKMEAVFYNGPVVELLSPEEYASHPKLRALGPDILGPVFDREEAWRRLAPARDREIGDVLLDQTVVSGVGNIFKSESLFLAKIHPRRLVRDIPREEIEVLWRMVIPIMRAAAKTSGPIVTLPPNLQSDRERNWVYARSSRPCFLCGTRIRMIRQGDLKRVTYFCEKCQPFDTAQKAPLNRGGSAGTGSAGVSPALGPQASRLLVPSPRSIVLAAQAGVTPALPVCALPPPPSQRLTEASSPSNSSSGRDLNAAVWKRLSLFLRSRRVPPRKGLRYAPLSTLQQQR